MASAIKRRTGVRGDGFLLYLLSRLGRCLILGRRRRRRRRALCGLNVEKQVVPGYAPTQTGPPHLGQVNSVLSGSRRTAGEGRAAPPGAAPVVSGLGVSSPSPSPSPSPMKLPVGPTGLTSLTR